MYTGKAYSNPAQSGSMPVNLYCCFFLSLILSFFSFYSFAQEEPEYDEIPVFLEVPRFGGTDITALIRGDQLYLPVMDVFNFLKVRNIPASGLESVSGFFINSEAIYLINYTDHLIKYQDRIFNLSPGELIRTESNLYLLSSYFGKVFGLDCIFNFRSMSIRVNSKLELPMIKEMRLEEMRRNLTRLKGEVKADTAIGRTYPAFRFGIADWSAVATEESNSKTDARINLSLGSMIAGGEATVSLNYSSLTPFDEKQQYYQWRYVDNDSKPLRQVMAGKIAANATSTIYYPVVGIQFTNTPTTYRRSFGSYTLSDRTEPGWIVELYVNNVLVDYVKADASGFFTFEVPLVYGNSTVTLKFFGPWGEERTREQNIIIPFNFLPKNTFEYNIGTGIVEDTLSSRFSRASFNYGVTRKLTIGGGVEYLSSVRSGPVMPFLTTSLSILNNILISGEYTYGVRYRGTLSYRFPSNLQFDVQYIKYEKDQKAINYNYLEERKAIISMPLRIKKFTSFQRISLYQILFPGSSYTTGEWLFSGSFLGVNTNLTTYALFVHDARANVYSNFSLSLRLPAEFVFMPQVQYGFTRNNLMSMKLLVEKRLKERAYFNIGYEQNFANDLRIASMGVRYDFSFAQTGLTYRQIDRNTSLTQYARGSLIADHKSRYHVVDNRPNVGKGGISVIPYLDLNSNRKRDTGEPKVYGLNLRAGGGRVERSERDSTIRILGLEPYTTCFIELDANSFENVSWRLPVHTLNVSVDPNILKIIEIPVTVAGEASGSVSLDINGEKKGQGRIVVSFYSGKIKPSGKILTEDDGYFSYFGLAPGLYDVMIDTVQLKKLGLISDPVSRQFVIKAGSEGDEVDGLNFTLYTQIGDTTGQHRLKISGETVVKKDTAHMIIHQILQELYTVTKESWTIEVRTSALKADAEKLLKTLEKQVGGKIDLIFEDNIYKVRITGIKSLEDASKVIDILQKNGTKELWLINMRNKKLLVITQNRVDTIKELKEVLSSSNIPRFSPDMSILAGSFRRESKALSLKNKLSNLFDKPVRIVSEDRFFKVRISGFNSPEELNRSINSLGLKGLKDLPKLPVKQPEVTPSEVLRDTARITSEVKKDLTVTARPDTTIKTAEEKIKLPESSPEPAISLQVAIFYKQSQALHARTRIMSKLNLPVVIIEQWGFFRVVIPGFYTREETYKYYPELAGIGYPSILMIDRRK